MKKTNSTDILKLKYSIWAYEKQCFFLFLEQNYLLFQNTQAFFVVNYFWMNLNYFFCQNSYLRLNFWQKKRDKIIGFLYVEPLNSEVNLYAEVKIYCKFVRGGNFYYKSVQRGKSFRVVKLPYLKKIWGKLPVGNLPHQKTWPNHMIINIVS